MEMYKILDKENRALILREINSWYTSDCLPTELKKAKVVSIFKKGETQNIANYRPISLLNSLYKIYASLLKNRLASEMENHLHKTQYGFRPKRSTVQALYIARRLQEIADHGGNSLAMVFLDWEEAFDKISQDKLMEALR